MYKCLKKGWIPLQDLADKYNLNHYKRNIIIVKLEDRYKEQIGRTWVVVENQALRHISKDN